MSAGGTNQEFNRYDVDKSDSLDRVELEARAAAQQRAAVDMGRMDPEGSGAVISRAAEHPISRPNDRLPVPPAVPARRPSRPHGNIAAGCMPTDLSSPVAPPSAVDAPSCLLGNDDCSSESSCRCSNCVLLLDAQHKHDVAILSSRVSCGAQAPICGQLLCEHKRCHTNKGWTTRAALQRQLASCERWHHKSGCHRASFRTVNLASPLDLLLETPPISTHSLRLDNQTPPKMLLPQSIASNLRQ